MPPRPRSSWRPRGRIAWLAALAAALLGPPAALGAAPSGADSSQALHAGALRVFLDCSECGPEYTDYVRTQITFVNHVRDRNVAQVHVLATSQATGGEGIEATVTFIGRKEFAGINDTLRFVAKAAETDEVIRRELVRVVKLGLMRYASHTPLGSHLTIGFDSREPQAPAAVRDRWNNWVFSTNVEGFFSGESSTRSISTWGSLSASRVTLESKFSVSVSANYNENRFDLGGGQHVLSVSRGQSASSRDVWALGDHWSAAVSAFTSTSTYSNLDLNLGVGPAVEYNVFPYTQSTLRQLRYSYRVRYEHADYHEVTIFNKTSESLVRGELGVTLDVKEPWGSAGVSLKGSHYLHDFGKNRMEASGSQSFRLWEGLSLRLSFNASRIRDQLSLTAAGATTEEILLRRKQLATQYQYWVSTGLSYTFGAIYNNVVNARFGD